MTTPTLCKVTFSTVLSAGTFSFLHGAFAFFPQESYSNLVDEVCSSLRIHEEYISETIVNNKICN
jgi:hypothetical protein